MEETFVPIKNTVNYFIEHSGRVIKIVNRREVEVKPFKSKSNIWQVIINEKAENHLYLMIAHFKPEIKITHKISYKIGKDGLLNADSIKIKPFINNNLSEKDERLMYDYMCEQKAISANSRGKGIISAVEVYIALKTYGYKCVYCRDRINEKCWHLDHYYGLSTSHGRNEFNNIVPTCPNCNLLKGRFDPIFFYKKCVEIALNNSFLDDYAACQNPNKDGELVGLISRVYDVITELRLTNPKLFKNG